MRSRGIRVLDIATQAPVDLVYIFRRDATGTWRPIAQADADGRATVTVPDGTALRFERVGYQPQVESIERGPTFYLEGGTELAPVVVTRPAPTGGAWWLLGAAVALLVLTDR